MHNILFTTKEFAQELAIGELNILTGIKPRLLENGILILEVSQYDKIKEIASNVIYFSRLVENIYLVIENVNNNGKDDIMKNIKLDLSFIIDNLTFSARSIGYEKSGDVNRELGDLILNSSNKLRVDLSKPDLQFVKFKTSKGMEYVLLDLFGRDLLKRKYKINVNSNSINSIVPNYCFYLFGLDNLKKSVKMLVLNANMGDIAIEAGIFNKRVPLNIKERVNCCISKISNLPIDIPKSNFLKDKSLIDVTAVVDLSKVYMLLKENMAYAGVKFKLSKFELDWIDVKYKEGQFDYVFCYLPLFHEKVEEDDYMKEFFYQVEYVCSSKICLISKKQVQKKYYQKYKFKNEFSEEIFIGEQKYFIIILSK